MELPSSLAPRRPDSATTKVPRVIYQTFKDRAVPPAMFRAASSWIARNESFAYRYFDDAAMFDFVAAFDCAGFSFASRQLASAIAKIKPGAGKADLFRYLLVYSQGGVYMDIDTYCLTPLQRIIGAEDDLVTGIGGRGDFHQWGLIYAPRHPFLKRAIENAVANILQERFVPGFENSLEGLAGPPCLDLSIKQVLGLPLHSRFTPGVFHVHIEGVKYQTRILPSDFFGGNVGFKYPGYRDDLGAAGVRYWMDEALFEK